MSRHLGILCLAVAVCGCFKDFSAEPSIRERPALKPLAESPPIFPEQVQPKNAHQIAEALWDEIDRESATPPLAKVNK